MNYIYLGKIVNTHGIKGEIRILSDFKYKDTVFNKGNFIYIGKEKIKEELNSYRVHKNYDMVTLVGINDINDVLKYKGKDVYINRDEYNFEGLLYEDIIGMDVYENEKYLGKVVDILKSSAHPILEVVNNDDKILIPYIDEFILDADKEINKISVKLIEGLRNDN